MHQKKTNLTDVSACKLVSWSLFKTRTLTHLVLFMPQVVHKASTRERHCCRFAACLVMVSQVSPHAFISFSMVLRQVSLGHLFSTSYPVSSVGLFWVTFNTCPSQKRINKLLKLLHISFVPIWTILLTYTPSNDVHV